jgi:hypothetical protein
MKIYIFLLLSMSSFRSQKVSGNEVHYNGLTRVTCPVPEDDLPIVSVGVAMASL